MALYFPSEIFVVHTLTNVGIGIKCNWTLKMREVTLGKKVDKISEELVIK